MARKARLIVPGAVHHIMARGIEGRNIFYDDEDRNFFLSLLFDCISRSGYKCYAWVLMDNHYHILFRVSEYPLGEVMRRLNSRYAMWYRKKYTGRGYLFQDRYKSIVTQDQGYIEQLVRYIHLNPVRAGKCNNIEELEEYPWSGHGALMGKKACSFQHTADILKRFTKTGQSGADGYREYVARGLTEDEQGDFLKYLRMSNNGTIDRKDYRCWIIGNRDFVKKAIESDKANRIRLSSYSAKGLTVGKIAKAAAHQMGIKKEEVYKRGRKNNRSILRKVVAALSHRKFGIPVSEVARYYRIGDSSVSRMLDEGERYIKKYNIKIE